ncbi:MAG: serine/threonine-protein kinase [Nannocystaceae bacterium]|nr:serine/threonine protein kinase [Myxococcales bacterium]
MTSNEHEQPKTIVSGGAVPQAITGEYARPSYDDDLTGSVLLGRYQILEPLGVGGMGSVYLCEHTTILKKFAVKVLSAELSQRPDHVDRFLREARASSMISHPNVVEITDFGQTPSGAPFFVMEYLEGQDLSEVIENEDKLPWDRVKPLMMQICGALQAAHDQGIVHRDMKPGNVLLLNRTKGKEFCKVLDFGIAKVTSQEVADRTLTQSGTVIGTPEYMSPEQGWGNPVDHRGDIYAVGVILYELLTGRVPFSGQSLMEILNRHMYEVPDVDQPEIPEEVGKIILKAMQKDRELRFQSMDEMIKALEAVGTGTGTVEVVDEEIKTPWGNVTARFSATAPPPKSRVPLFVGLGAVLLGLAVIAFMIQGQQQAQPDARPTENPTLPVAAPPQATDADDPEEAPAKRAPPAPVVLAPDAERVRFKITTEGVNAQILDARDEGMYGMTNDEEGVEVEKSKEELRLILRADGYKDLEFTIIPDRDKDFNKDLEKVRRQNTRRPPKGKTKPEPDEPTPTVEPKPEKKPPEKKPPETKKKEGLGTDLMNPFGN